MVYPKFETKSKRYLLKSHPALKSNENKTSPVVELIDLLQKIDTKGRLAKLNATSIADNNGGRIQL
jgi:hypothetical protein